MSTLTFHQPRLVALILLVLISAGLASFLSLGRQEDPTITNIYATVTTQFPGADPARVETLVTAEIEEKLQAITEVDIVTSVSRSGVSVVSIDLLETLDKATIEQVWSEARDAVEAASRSFPPGVLVPDFNAEGISTYSSVIAVTADHEGVPPAILQSHAATLADRMRAIPSTRVVDVFGEPETEILVSLDAQAAAGLGLTARDVSRMIIGADGKVQAGRIQSDDVNLTINISGAIETLERLGSVVLLQNADGAAVSLADIATITRGVREPVHEMAMANGKRAVLVAVLAQDGVQIDRWMRYVRDALAAGAAKVPVGLSETVMFDQSTYTIDRLADVGTNMAIGVGLVVLVLFVTLGLRAAAIVAVVLPVVSLATLASMNFMGLPLHQMSVTGLIVALGLLVDAAIVMVDEVRQRLGQGMQRADAVGDATSRLAAPLLASTVTTALSFTPMILLPGPSGDFVGSIAIAVVLMLLWSLFVALTVTPALAGWFLKSNARSGLQIPALGRGFEALIRLSVRNPVRSMALALVLPILGFAASSTLTAQFFPGVERDQFYIEIDLPPGSSIAQTESLARQIDARLADMAGVDRVYWSLGRSGPSFYYNILGGRSTEPGYAEAMVKTVTAEDAARIVPLLQAELDRDHPQARMIVRDLVQGPPVAAPIEVRIVGPNIDTLRALGNEARAIIADLDLVTQARAQVVSGAPQLRYYIDEPAVRRLGMNLTDIAAQLESGLVGVTGGSLVEGTDQLPVRVRFGDDLRGNLEGVNDLPILLPNATALAGQGFLPAVPFSQLANTVLEPAESVITRRNGERINTVQAFIVPGVLPEEALQDVLAALDERGFDVPLGYRIELGGDSDARSDTVGNLLASVGLIVTLMIAVIVLTFNSFRLSGIALVVCVLSAGLSMLSLAVLQFPFGITAIIGVIGSIGVSINAAIIILTGLKADPDAAAGETDAIARVVTGSSRHITSTTITTFGGFLPLILAGGGFWPPFAVAVAGGVMLSAVISFFFTPAAFTLFYGDKNAGTTSASLSTVDQRIAALAGE